MSGLEERLRSVAGVSDLTIELGKDGLEAIRLRIDESTNEASVLEEIRRILIAYGLRSRRPSLRGDRRIETVSEGLEDVIGAIPEAGAKGDLVNIEVGPHDSGLVVRLVEGGQTAEATADRTPVGAAVAMVQAVAELRSLPTPDRVAIALDDLDETPVVTILARKSGVTVVGVGVCAPSFRRGLFEAALMTLRRLASTIAATD